MLKRLTPEQEGRLPEFREKWLEIGLSCAPLDVERARGAVSRAYVEARLEPPTLWLSADSPLSAAIMAWFLNRAQVGAQVRAQVGAQVGDQVWDQVRAQVGAQVWAQVRAQVWDQVYGSHDAGWLAFYDYMATVLKVVAAERSRPLMELAESCGWWAPYQGAAILQHRHCELHRNPQGLHRDGGPAVLYLDGFAVWALNGVRVPQWLAETPATAVNCRKLAGITNAEVRREFVRKVGVERIGVELGARVLDVLGSYELHDLDVGDGRHRPYLKMLNPSLGIWHYEGVHPSCRTVEQALAWRDGESTYVVPDALS